MWICYLLALIIAIHQSHPSFQEEVAKMARDMVDRFGTQRYIANLGHGINRWISPDRVEAFVNAIHDHSSQEDD